MSQIKKINVHYFRNTPQIKRDSHIDAVGSSKNPTVADESTSAESTSLGRLIVLNFNDQCDLPRVFQDLHIVPADDPRLSSLIWHTATYIYVNMALAVNPNGWEESIVSSERALR